VDSEAALWRAGGGLLVLLLAALIAKRNIFRVRARDLPLFAVWGMIGVALFSRPT